MILKKSVGVPDAFLLLSDKITNTVSYCFKIISRGNGLFNENTLFRSASVPIAALCVPKLAKRRRAAFRFASDVASYDHSATPQCCKENRAKD